MYPFKLPIFIFHFISAIHLPSHWKESKYLRINPPKEANDLYSENCNMVMKEIEDDTNRKIDHVLGFKKSILPKQLHYPR